jgi:putative solute:sodium symporter small subunit
MRLSERHRIHWRRNLRLTAALLCLWFLVSFGVSYFARDLNFDFFGWPFSFWMGAQGSVLVYLLIIGFYAYRMNRLDAQCGVEEDQE